MIALVEHSKETSERGKPGTKSTYSFVFRGKNTFSWKTKLFHDADKHFSPYKDNSPGQEIPFNFLLVFNPLTFLKIGPGGIRELYSRLKNIKGLSTLEGPHIPFITLPVVLFNEWRLDINDTGLFDRLKEAKGIFTIPLESEYQILELKADFRAVEDFIVDLQVSELLENGVIIEDFNHFYLEGLVPVGEGTRISSGVVVTGTSRIGKNVTLYPNVFIENSVIGDNCLVLPGCIVRDSILENNVRIGPHTHLRNGALVREGAKMGNFVEMKKSVLGKGSKAMHLTYLGDAEIGEKVNIGAGTITCNYDGVNKNKTVIEDNVFIGSGTELVAPVTIRKNGYVAAGSTITEEVPEDSLGVARERQRNIMGWVKRKREKTALKKCDV
jgi:tetrahydrodipicolinate N-succinyltransferase